MKLIQECTLTPFSHIQPWIFDEILVLDHLQRIAQLIDFKFWMAFKDCLYFGFLKILFINNWKSGLQVDPLFPFCRYPPSSVWGQYPPSERNSQIFDNKYFWKYLSEDPILHLRKILKFLTTHTSGAIWFSKAVKQDCAALHNLDFCSHLMKPFNLIYNPQCWIMLWENRFKECLKA